MRKISCLLLTLCLMFSHNLNVKCESGSAEGDAENVPSSPLDNYVEVHFMDYKKEEVNILMFYLK